MNTCLIDLYGTPCNNKCEDCDIIGEFDNTKIYKKLYTDGSADICCPTIKRQVHIVEAFELVMDKDKCDKCIYKRLR